MANLNLSEFTEKLFVADADHTFIWDTAASISKRVSRNSWLNSGTLTSDAPVTISQTWGTTGTYTAAKINVTETATANPASRLLDLQIGGVTTASINKAGQFFAGSASQFLSLIQSDAYIRNVSSGRAASLWAEECRIVGGPLVFSDSPNVNISTISAGVALYKEAANTLALRNGAAAQTFNVYGTYTSGTSYERLTLSAPSAANAIIGTNKGSGGGTARGLDLHTDGSARMTITAAGNVGIGTTAPTAPLHVQATAISGREDILKCTVSDAGNNAFYVYNSTGTTGSFAPAFAGSLFSNITNPPLSFAAQTTAGSDNGSVPLMLYQSRITDSETNPNNGNFTSVVTRPLFGWANLGTTHMLMAANGNLGIGTTAPTAPLEIRGTAVSDIREPLLKCTVSDAGNDAFHVFNATSANNRFIPGFSGSVFANVGSLIFSGQTTAANDNGIVPLTLYVGRLTSSETDPNNGTLTTVSTRPLFGWYNHTTSLMQMAANGNLGIGTTSPTSKLHVAGTIKPEQATMVDKAAGFTLAAVDAGTVINSTSATAITINLPAADTAAGYNVMIIQSGAGAVTIAANGNTLNSFGSAFTTAGQHAACSIVRTAASTYNLSGNLV